MVTTIQHISIMIMTDIQNQKLPRNNNLFILYYLNIRYGIFIYVKKASFGFTTKPQTSNKDDFDFIS